MVLNQSEQPDLCGHAQLHAEVNFRGVLRHTEGGIVDNVIAIIVVGFALFAIPFTFANLHAKSPRLMVGFVLALVFTAPIPAIGGLVFFFGFVVAAFLAWERRGLDKLSSEFVKAVELREATSGTDGTSEEQRKASTAPTTNHRHKIPMKPAKLPSSGVGSDQRIDAAAANKYRLASFVAKDHGVSESTIIAMIREGLIEGVLMDGYWRVPIAAKVENSLIKDYVSNQPDAQPLTPHSQATHVSEQKSAVNAKEQLDPDARWARKVVQLVCERLESQPVELTGMTSSEREIIGKLSLALKHKGMLQQQAADTIWKMAQKEGGITFLAYRYSGSSGPPD